MANQDDCTEILKMKKDFQVFMAKSMETTKRAHHSSVRSNLGGEPVQLNFDRSSVLFSDDDYPSASKYSKSSSSMSIASIIEKDHEIKKKKGELIEATATIAKMQQQISKLKTSQERQRIEMEKDIQNIKQESSHKKDRLEDLKNQLFRVMRLEEESQQKLTECRKELASAKTSSRAEISALQRAKIGLECNMAELQQTSQAEIIELQSEKMHQQMEIDNCRSELLEAQDLLAASEKRCNDLNMRLQELDEQNMKSFNTEYKVKDLQTKLNRMEEDAVVTKAMKNRLERLSELERENRTLREENTYCKNTKENVHLLREKLESATQRLTRAESRAAEAAQLQAKCEDLEKRLEKWESCSVTGNNRPSSPTQVKRQMANLQQSNLLTLEKQGELQATASSQGQALWEAQNEIHLTKRRLVEEQQKLGQNTEFNKRLQRKLLLLKKERDGYKQILESYENDVTMNTHTSQGATRVRHLEETLQGYRNQEAQIESMVELTMSQRYAAEEKVVQLQAELETRVAQQPSGSTSEADQKIIATLRQQVAEAQKELEKVMEERDVLAARIEQRHLQGDYDPTTTKVIHLKVNPSSVAQEQRAAEIRHLREGKEALQERLQLLEEAGGQVADITMKVQEKLAEPSSSQEIQEIRVLLNSAELKNQRLMEAFKKKSQEFREVCFQLLGYRIDIPTDNQYRLMNIYAESPDEFLMFQQSESGVMQLLSTDYSTCLDDKIETYLQHADSIPAFLSSITLQLFNRQTTLQQSMVVP